MATSVILTKPNGQVSSVNTTSFSIVDSIEDVSQTSQIISKDYKTKTIETSDYFETEITDKNTLIFMPSEVLPFRISFTTLGIESYGPNNPPPIGIAIVGDNNYIL